MNFKPFLIFLLFCPSLALAQRYFVSGYVTDAESGEALIGANVVNPKTSEGTAVNTFGFYSITLGADSLRLRYSFVGYEPVAVNFLLTKDTTLNIQLRPLNQLEEVVVTADIPIEENTQMSRVDLPVAQIKSLPALLGEVDVLKVIQLLPGVQSGTEGSSGIYVRGGGPDQNLILLDGVPVYNASHLFGFFSVFNADAINKVELIKGGFPARYGGRLSSVIDISMKEGNMKEFHGEGGIGLIASRLTLEGPIVKDKASFIISGRRTYIDILARPLIKAQSDGNSIVGYYFYDLNGKINYKFSERDRLFVSAYLGDDRFYMRDKFDYWNSDVHFEKKDEAGLNWGNITTAVRWNHLINSKLFSNATVTYSRYRFNTFLSKEEKITENGKTNQENFGLNYLSGIRDFSFKTDFDYLPGPNHFVRVGANVIHHTFEPGASVFNLVELDTLLGADPTYAIEHAIYAEDDYKISDKLKVNAGLHFSGFAVEGRYYKSLQPRISARYLFGHSISLKASYAQMAQFIHLLTNSGIGMPTDLWVPATDRIKPQSSKQWALGAAKTLFRDYEISLEGYYKRMNNVIEYKEGASFLNVDKNWENKVTKGEGWSYGMEFFFQKKAGRTTGWIGYTLAWANRQFNRGGFEDRLNSGKVFPYKYDRRHDLSLTILHKINPKIEFSGTWVYGTGNAVTLPIGTYSGLPENLNPNPHPYQWGGTNRISRIIAIETNSGCLLTTGWIWALALLNRRNGESAGGFWGFTMHTTAKTPSLLMYPMTKMETSNLTNTASLYLFLPFPTISLSDYEKFNKNNRSRIAYTVCLRKGSGHRCAI
jgi:hypothetical protein